MIPKECKRLAEVDFPLSAVNDACVEENNRKTRVDSGHLSLLHSWWARRPLASCRSLLLTLLLPDPCDPHCPKDFKSKATKILSNVAGWTSERVKRQVRTDDGLKNILLRFVSDIARWDNINETHYRSAAIGLVEAVYGSNVPHVLDPFSGGGSIPLEAQRLGCEVTASDLNPVAWLLLKIALEWSARKGPELANIFDEWSDWTLKEAEKRLGEYYPADEQNRKPLAYIWARTIRCEAPGCGAVVPLVRNLWLSDASSRKKAIRFRYFKKADAPIVDIFSPASNDEVAEGTVAGFKATCPKCHQTTPRERVQSQLCAHNGGAEESILLAIVRQNNNSRGKDYYAPRPQDISAIQAAFAKAQKGKFKTATFPQNDTRAFPPGPYGIKTWGDVLSPRQLFSRWVLHEVIEDALKEAGKKIRNKGLLNALAACLYAAFSDNAQYHTTLCVWLSEGVKSIFIQGSGVPMRADFVEGNPLSPNCEGLNYSIRSIQSALRNLSTVRYKPSSPLLSNVLDAMLPEDSVDVVFTDPPYANQIPYAHLSDFFYSWLRLGLRTRLPQAFTAFETEKSRELTENRAVKDGGTHDRAWYESGMYEAFERLKRVIREDGVASFVFAHKDTDRWEALVSALVRAGWRTTGSWPIATERRQRMRGQGYAALETSVHLICRPRPEDAPIGDWGEVLRELPNRVGDWMERLQGENIRGADLVFACIGPALEIFSRYRKVETADGSEVTLAEYLEKVWEVVGRTALEQILGTAEARARNGMAGALEEDARLTALFLWTLQSTNGEGGNRKGAKHAEEDETEEDSAESPSQGGKKGYSLVFDVARRFAQPLGIDLAKWEHRIIETDKGVVRLLSVSERAKQIFGSAGIESAIEELLEPAPSGQLVLPGFEEFVSQGKHKKRSRGQKISIEDPGELHAAATTLDRVHAAMLLQSGGQSNALRMLIKAEQDRGPDFLRLANALSALYPMGSEEKRLLDAMLLAVPR